ncbi:hypothetical protein GCM10009414_27160 [Tatumella terrea]
MKLMSDIPAAELWKNWQPEEFDLTGEIITASLPQPDIAQPPAPAPEGEAPPRHSAPPPSAPCPVSLTEEEKQQAWQEGYQQGMARGEMLGHQRGIDEALQQARQESAQKTEEMQQQLSGLAAGFSRSLAMFDGMVTGRLLQLALQIAWQICGDNVACDTRLLTENIRQLLAQDPLFSGTPFLRVHPQDLDVAQQVFGTQISEHGWQLVADATLRPGDCRLQGEDGELDSSLSTRWLALCQRAQSGAY